jgi:hypothetical protein
MYRLLRCDLYQLNVTDKYHSKQPSPSPDIPPFYHSWHCRSRALHSPCQTSQSHSYTSTEAHKRDLELASV